MGMFVISEWGRKERINIQYPISNSKAKTKSYRIDFGFALAIDY